MVPASSEAADLALAPVSASADITVMVMSRMTMDIATTSSMSVSPRSAGRAAAMARLLASLFDVGEVRVGAVPARLPVGAVGLHHRLPALQHVLEVVVPGVLGHPVEDVLVHQRLQAGAGVRVAAVPG